MRKAMHLGYQAWLTFAQIQLDFETENEDSLYLDAGH
jgi:hypothetical protein